MNLKDIAKHIEATLFGDPDLVVSSLKSLSEATSSDLTLLLEDKYIDRATQSLANVFITHKKIDHIQHQLVAKNPRRSLALAIRLFYSDRLLPYIADSAANEAIHSSAKIDNDVRLGHFVTIAPDVVIQKGTVVMSHVFIGKSCKIGKNCMIYPNVTILDDSVIGDDCIIHSGTVIGSDGFSYARDDQGYLKVPHVGSVNIGDSVEIGSNVSIDRACLDKTIIKSGAKIDNLVHIAHNSEIGVSTAIAAQTGMTGGTKIGDNVMIAGHVAIDNSEIGHNVVILGKSGVTKNIASNSMVSGFPARDHKIELKEKAKLKKLLK